MARLKQSESGEKLAFYSTLSIQFSIILYNLLQSVREGRHDCNQNYRTSVGLRPQITAKHWQKKIEHNNGTCPASPWERTSDNKRVKHS